MDYTGSPPAAACAHFAASYPPEEVASAFKRKYPPDPFGQELNAGARVWEVYKDEVTAYDKSLLSGWNKTLDILLIFAGLFSAVATAFVIESYKLLQPDDDEYIANALFDALSFIRNESSLPNLRGLHAVDVISLAQRRLDYQSGAVLDRGLSVHPAKAMARGVQHSSDGT